ncbi:MAG: universal stress protein [Gemmatimonadales bacterium]|nr:MAG: universal stress protein [Gemmatimonadales bacterium]
MNILLATDGSRYAREAASFLRSHLDPAAAVRIELATVIAPPGPAASAASGRSGEVPGRRRARAQEWLEQTRKELGPELAPVRSRILYGSPEDILVREACRHDLVVAGVKGSGAAPFFELGRVARALLRHADCSVLLVRNQRAPEEGKPFHVLVTQAVAGDGLPPGWSLLQPFALSRASLEVVTVLDRDTRSSGGGTAGDQRDRTRRWLTRTAGRLRVPSGQPRCALLEGRPGAELERRALETGADLLVVGARRGEAPGPGPLGSTARELAWRAPCSVLTVRHRQAVPTLEMVSSADAGADIQA